jgi:hypothetical protein
MAIYRFKVSFEDFDDIVREIDIKSNQTFEDLHLAIHRSTGYNPSQSSSFYVSNDQWLKGQEIAFMPSQRKIDRGGIVLMEKSKLSSFIDDPHQKFYYTYNFDRPYDFHVELIKILLDDDKTRQYPFISKTTGEAPKPLIPGGIAAAAAASESDDFDFLNETEYQLGDAEDMDELNPHEPDAGDEEAEEEEKDEFMDEFSDDEGFESGEYSKDDY